MNVDDALNLVYDIAEKNFIDKPYIVGGLARDVYLGRDIRTSDVDITTNSADVLRLGILVAVALNVTFELSDDGHITVYTDSFDIDFSSNFESEEVIRHIGSGKRQLAEAFSRDFTINTLHQDIKTREILDPTGRAFQDVKDGFIKCPVPPKITFTDDPRRIYRAVNLAVRYNFEIADEIVQFAINNQELFASEKIKEKYVTVKLARALKLDADKTIKLLKQLKLFKSVPLVGMFKDALIEKKMLSEYLQDV
jgi:tRNA nucleotidyltransferase/poly(A) polymerase